LKHFAALTELLVKNDPRVAIEKTLAFVIAQAGARKGAILTVKGQHPSVFGRVPLETVSGIQALWNSQQEALRGGRHVATKGDFLVPLRDSSALIAVLYLEKPQRFEAEELTAPLVALAQAVIASEREGVPAPADDFDGYLASTTIDALERRHLLVALHRNEWNIARVARILGVTRRTIYLRLKRHGIPREHVVKTA